MARGRTIGGDIAEVAVYDGEQLVISGTIRHCAKELGIRKETLYFYLMPSYERRLAKRKRSDPSRVRRVVLL